MQTGEPLGLSSLIESSRSMRDPVSKDVDLVPKAYTHICPLASTSLFNIHALIKEMQYAVSVKQRDVGFHGEFKHVSVVTSSQKCPPHFFQFLKFILLFNMFGCFACMYVCVCTTYMSNTLRGHGSPGTGIIDGCDPIHGCWELNLGSQE